jgi:hypothetical protein
MAGFSGHSIHSVPYPPVQNQSGAYSSTERKHAHRSFMVLLAGPAMTFGQRRRVRIMLNVNRQLQHVLKRLLQFEALEARKVWRSAKAPGRKLQRAGRANADPLQGATVRATAHQLNDFVTHVARNRFGSSEDTSRCGTQSDTLKFRRKGAYTQIRAT